MIEGTICPTCGKEFFPTPEHVYKASGKRYCCYTCLIHRKKKKTKNHKQVEQYTIDGVFIREFESVKEAAEFVNGTENHIRGACSGRFKEAYKSKWKYKD